MKRKFALLVMAALMLSGCGNTKVDNQTAQTSQKEEMSVAKGMKDLKGTVALELELDKFDEDLMEKADGYSNGSMFDCTWRANNITFDNNVMTMKLDSDGEGADPKWSGSEYRSRNFYHYGMYEVKMKPIKNDGIVSSFFTYTGPSDNNPWDEIDIEFLGKDTTKVQFNYFTNGEGNHEYVYDLGFDAAEEFHEYGFEWKEDSITWYVDGAAVYTATENIPVTPSKLMMNVWPGTGVDNWLKAFNGNVPLIAEYEWLRVTSYDTK